MAYQQVDLKLPTLQYRRPADPNAQHGLATLGPMIQAARDEGERPTKYGTAARGLTKAVEVYQAAAEKTRERFDKQYEAAKKKHDEWAKSERDFYEQATLQWERLVAGARKSQGGGGARKGTSGGGLDSLTPPGRAHEYFRDRVSQQAKNTLFGDTPQYQFVKDQNYFARNIGFNERTEFQGLQNVRQEARDMGTDWYGAKLLADGYNEHTNPFVLARLAGQSLLPSKGVDKDGNEIELPAALRLVRRNKRGYFRLDPRGNIYPLPQTKNAVKRDNFIYALVPNEGKWDVRSSSGKVGEGANQLDIADIDTPIDLNSLAAAEDAGDPALVKALGDEEIKRRNSNLEVFSLNPASKRYQDEMWRQGNLFDQWVIANDEAASQRAGAGVRGMPPTPVAEMMNEWRGRFKEPPLPDPSGGQTRWEAMGGLPGLVGGAARGVGRGLEAAVNLLRGGGDAPDPAAGGVAAATDALTATGEDELPWVEALDAPATGGALPTLEAQPMTGIERSIGRVAGSLTPDDVARGMGGTIEVRDSGGNWQEFDVASLDKEFLASLPAEVLSKLGISLEDLR